MNLETVSLLERKAIRRLRFFVAAVVLGGLLAPSAAAQDARSCGVCHRNLHQDWLQSKHSQAWKSPDFQAQMKRFGNEQFCGRCHAPETIWETMDLRGDSAGSLDISKEIPDYTPLLRDMPDLRKQTPEDGVTCNSCHSVDVLWPAGKTEDFLGPYHTEEGHGGKRTKIFDTYRLCGVCHGRDPADYRHKSASSLDGFHHLGTIPLQFAFENSNCGSCHMPARQEKLVQLRAFKTVEARKVGEHTFSGKRYEELENALSLKLEKGEGSGILLISNAGVGHAPQTSAATAYRLEIAKFENGKKTSIQKFKLQEGSSLHPGQSLRIPLEFAPGAASVQVDFIRSSKGGFEETVFIKTFQ